MKAKRVLALVLALALAGSLLSCGKGTLTPGDTEETTETKETKGADTVTTMEETVSTEEVLPYTGLLSASDPIALTALKGSLKIRGKAVFDEKALHVDWPCAGFEASLDAAGGTLSLGYSFTTGTIVTVLVDGSEAARYRLIGKGTQELVTLSAGTHNVAILRDVETQAGEESVFTTLAFDGKLLDKPADKALYLEFIGDSIVSGNGALTEGKTVWQPLEKSATHAFGYLTAQALDADVIISGRGSIGLVKTVEDSRGMSYAMSALYPFATGMSSTPRIKYDFASARVPDVVILEVSTNDRSAVNDEDFQKAAEAFLKQIRASYGQDVPIVWVYSLMIQDHHEAVIHAVINAMGGESNGLYYLEMVQGQNGGKGTETGTCHPSYGDHVINAERLTAFLREKGLVG